MPGMPQRSRTCAAGSTCASTTASSRSTHIRPWICAHRPLQRALVGDRRDLLVAAEPALQLVVEPVVGPVADPEHMRADRGERAHELALVGGEAGLEEDDVHGRASPGSGHQVVEIERQHPPPGRPVVVVLRAPGVDPVRDALGAEHAGEAPGIVRGSPSARRRRRGCTKRRRSVSSSGARAEVRQEAHRRREVVVLGAARSRTAARGRSCRSCRPRRGRAKGSGRRPPRP